MEDAKYRELRSEMGVAFPMSLRAKMLITVGTLLASTLAVPAVYLNRDEIRAIEGTGALPETLSLWIGVVLLIGNLNTFFVGVYMLKYVWERTEETSLPPREKMEKRIRVEDFVMWFQIWGTLAVIVALAFLYAALVPGAPEAMYDVGITVYRPFETYTLDMRLTIGVTGGVFGLLLWAMWWFVR